MNRQDAIKELRRAGKTAELTEIIRRHANDAQRTYETLRSDQTLADAYRQQLIAAQHVRAQRALDAELDRAAGRIVRIDHNDAANVFGVEGLPGDPATLVRSRRDAGDRVATITDPKELTGLLRRATRTGDEVLARAIAERATEIRDADTMNKFLADRPNLDAAGTRLWNTEQAETGADFGITVFLAEVKAQEFSGMTLDQVEDVADDTKLTVPTTSHRLLDTSSATAGAATMRTYFV